MIPIGLNAVPTDTAHDMPAARAGSAGGGRRIERHLATALFLAAVLSGIVLPFLIG